MAMEKGSISSKNETDQMDDCTEASSDAQLSGEGEVSKFSDDVAGKEYFPLVDSGSSSVSGSAGIISDEKKQIVQSLKMKPIVLEKTKVIKILGVDIHVSTDSEYTIAYNPMVDSGSSSVLGSTAGIISDEKKQIVQSLKMKPIVFKKTKVIKILGVDIDVSAYSEYTTAYNPTPLRCFNPNTVVQSNDHLDQHEGHVENTEPEPEPEPEPLLDDFSRLLQDIEARIGARPVLLYQKKLTNSDVSDNLNRLFITRSQELMGFLREDERRRVEHEDKRIWLDVLATHPTGEMYELRLKMWHSLNMVVLKGSDWNAAIYNNDVEAGYFVELWAYREQDSEFRLAVNFKDAE